MNRDQLSSAFEYLWANSPQPEELCESLAARAIIGETPINAALYLPMYSMGMAAGIITARISWLQGNGWDLEQLAGATVQDRHSIAQAALDNGHAFGMLQRIEQLVERAGQIADRADELIEVLTPIDNWDCRELLAPLRALRPITGIGFAAAVHILMELGWGIVKPDRHICRFLSRLGGQLRLATRFTSVVCYKGWSVGKSAHVTRQP